MDLMNALGFVAVASLIVISPGPNGLLIAKTVPTFGKMAGFANIAGFVTALQFHGALSILGISAIVLASSKAFFVIRMLGAAYLCWIGVKALREALSGYTIKQFVEPAIRIVTRRTTKLYLKEIEHSSLLIELINQTQMNPWPAHMLREMNVYLITERRLQKNMDKEPTAENIAEECEMPVAAVKRMMVLRDQISPAYVSYKPDDDKDLSDLILDKNIPNPTSNHSAFVEGFLTNVLNPKTSMFYLAAFPQFITIGEGSAASTYILVLLDSLIYISWFGIMVILVARLSSLANKGAFQRWLNGVTGIVFIGFGAKLATY